MKQIRTRPSANQADHLGLDRSRLTEINGEITRESIYGGMIGYQAESQPSIKQALSRLSFKVNNEIEDIKYLSRYFGDQFFSSNSGLRIPVKKMLKAIGVGDDYPIEENYPLNYILSPKILAACIIVYGDASIAITSDVLKMASRLDWNREINLIKVFPDVYYIHKDPTLIRDAQVMPYSQIKRLNARQAKSSDYSKVKYQDLTSDLQSRMHESRENGQIYQGGSIDLIISHIPDRGYAIANVYLWHKTTGYKENFGQIKNVKGKLFYSCPSLLVSDQDRENFDREVRSKQLTQTQFIKRISDLRSQIKDLALQISSIRQRVRDCKNTMPLQGQLIELETNKNGLQSQLERLTKNMPDLRSNLYKLDRSIVFDVMALFKAIGLKPNAMLRSMPMDSPLCGILYWFKNFGIQVSQTDHTCPMVVVRDARKGSTKGKGKGK